MSGLGLILVSVLLSAEPNVSASMKVLVDEAAKAYAEGEYEQAITLLERARREQPVGRVLFNLARAYEKASRVEDAIAAYEQYVNAPDVEASMQHRAEAALAQLYRVVAERRAAAPPVPLAEPPLTVVEPRAAPTPRPDVPPAERALTPSPSVSLTAPVAPKPRGFLVTGVVLSVASLVALAVGVVCGVTAHDAASRVWATVDPIEKPALRRQALDWALAADVSYGFSGALAALAAGFFVGQVAMR